MFKYEENKEHIIYTLRHKWQICKLWFAYDTKVDFWDIFCHDLDKVFLYLFFDKKTVKKKHKEVFHHRGINTMNFAEKYLDWSSARYTKPDKQDDAMEYIIKLVKKKKTRKFGDIEDILVYATNHYEEVGFK